MTAAERKAKLEEAKAKRRQQKQEEAERGNWTGSYDELDWTAMQGADTKRDKIVRFVGNFPTTREEATDAKISLISKIKADDGKRMRCIWYDREEKPDWILYRLVDKVLDGKWNPDANGGKGAKEYYYDEKHPEIFKRVLEISKTKTGKTFTSTILPKKVLIANVIDRHDPDWHKENKKTKLLSKSSWTSQKEDGSSNVGYEFGVPQTVFARIMDDVVDYAGFWDEYDIALRRSKVEPWYWAFNCEDDIRKINPEDAKFIVNGALTEEELAYEKFDIDKITKVTSYSKLLKRLGLMFKAFDAAFGENLYEELKQLATEEKKAREEEEAKEEVEEGNSREPQKQPKEASTTRRAVVEEVNDEIEDIEDEEGLPWEALEDGSFNGTQYVGISKLSDQEKAWILGVNDDGSFDYDPEAGVLYPEQSTGFKSPEKFTHCPLTGLKFA